MSSESSNDNVADESTDTELAASAVGGSPIRGAALEDVGVESPAPTSAADDAPVVESVPGPEAGTAAEASARASAGECALAGCTEPLPAHGRGRPPKYCSKAHADQASRDRRAADAAAVDEPLRQAEALAQQVPTAISVLQDQLSQLQEFLAKAQDGALARVRRAEAETTAARQAEADAEARALSADKAREEAVAAAEAAIAAQRTAEQAAARDRAALEQVRVDTAEAIAAHRVALDAARDAQAAAETARDAKAAELRDLRTAHEQERARLEAAARAQADQLQALQTELTHSATALANTREALVAAQGETRAQQARADAAEQARDDAIRHGREAGARADALERRQQVFQSAAEKAAEEAAAAQSALAARQALCDRLETDLAAARADASTQRERAVRAEASLRKEDQDRAAPIDGADQDGEAPGKAPEHSN
ncbi:hypothetical protein AB0L25_31965 [Spirillospora sp. NPDC052242]